MSEWTYCHCPDRCLGGATLRPDQRCRVLCNMADERARFRASDPDKWEEMKQDAQLYPEERDHEPTEEE